MTDTAVEAIDAFITEQGVDASKGNWRTRLNPPPMVDLDSASTYFWDIETNVGSLSVRFMPDVAPMHVISTMYLTRLGFYDGLAFHRVITQFMAQGGCPLGTGTGGPGYQYAGEFSNSVRHDRPGLLSMANAGPRTDGSQFFLTFVATPWLDGNHTIFGEVVDGMDTLRALEARGTQSGGTTEHLEITRATVRVE